MINTAEYAAMQKNLGNMYLNGWGVAKDEVKAQEFYKKALDAYKILADNGNVDAQFEFVKISLDLIQVEAKKVFTQYKSKADNGDVKAKIRLGLMYAQGLGVEKDLDAARKIIESVKENVQIVDSELISLCVMVGDFEDALKFHAKAVQLFKIAAESGDTGDCSKFAKLYCNKNSANVADENFLKNLCKKFQPQNNQNPEMDKLIESAHLGDVDSILQLKKLSKEADTQAKVALEMLYYDGNKGHAVGTIVLRDDLTVIEYEAFLDCNELEKIILPDDLKSIRMKAFRGCSRLKEIIFADDLKTIGYWAFDGCSSLEKITLPKYLRSIGKNAFNGCSSLKEITLPKNLKSLEESALIDCPLENVSYYKKTEKILEDYFGDKWEGINKTILSK